MFTGLNCFGRTLRNLTNNSTFNSKTCHLERILYQYVMPIVLSTGIVSNIITLCTFRAKKFKGSSIAFYMRTYSVTNILCLVIAFGLDWLYTVTNHREIASLSPLGCKFYTFISVVLVFYGPWLLVAMTIDRYVSRKYSTLRATMTSTFMAKIATVFISVGVAVVSVHAMWISELHRDVCGLDFDKSSVHASLHSEIFHWLHIICNLYLPTILLLTLNVMLLKYRCTTHKQKTENACISTNRQNDRKRFECEMENIVMCLSWTCFFFKLPAIAMHITNIVVTHGHYPPDVISTIESIAQVIAITAHGHQLTTLVTCVAVSKSFRQEMLSSCRQLRYVVLCARDSERDDKKNKKDDEMSKALQQHKTDDITEL